VSVPELPSALRSLIEVGLSLARRTASGRVGMARYAPLVDDAAVPEAVRAEVRAELDGAWDAVVVPFDTKERGEVLAVTPTAQVHAGELDGEPVAIKIARPGVAAQIRAELALLDTLAAPLRMVFPTLDVRGVMREVRETVMDELDLEHEAETSHQVRRALRRLDDVVVPRAYVDDSAPGRLVTERLEGQAAPEDPERAAELLVAAHLVAWREAGLVLTDARPAHLVFLADGRLGLLGTGLARPVARDRMEHFVAAFEALADDDAAAFVAAVEALELQSAESAERAHALLRDLLGDFVRGPARLDAAAICELTVRGYERLGDFMALAADVTPDPADVHAARMLGQLGATLARLEVTTDWPALVARAASAG
jgi:predicted unusual protein kinase regulating ubiquinone biosynthesis (AarF/ABC1/UbiB family)